MAPEQEALYALQWNVPRGELSVAAQLEYDRLRPAWERGEFRPAAGKLEAARLAWERAHLHEQRGSWLVTKPGRYLRPVTGDQVRDTTFLSLGDGYDMAEVDDLLSRVADALDADRPAGPLIRNAAFRTRWRNGYAINAVDWFLGQLLIRPTPAELAEMSADPWRDLGVVAQFSRSGANDLTGRFGKPSRRTLRGYYSTECWKARLNFDRVPGVQMRWEDAGPKRGQALTRELQVIATASAQRRSPFITVGIGENSFVLNKMTAERPPSPGIADIDTRNFQDFAGHFAALTAEDRRRKETEFKRIFSVNELVDDAGTTILYTSGTHSNYKAWASISFSDQRWLRFPVRGTGRGDAIMTAVDEAGNSVVRYRIIDEFIRGNTTAITVHPDWELTDELMLAIMISAPWLDSCFVVPSGGGQ